MGPQSASSRGRMNGTVRRACQAFRCARGAHPVEMKRAALPPPRPARRHPPSTSTAPSATAPPPVARAARRCGGSSASSGWLRLRLPRPVSCN